MPSIICPYCNTKNPLYEGASLGMLPPTGGDYEWQESDTNHTCCNCQEKFEIRVRTSLESGACLLLKSSPKPLVVSIIWYAIATIEKNITSASQVETFNVRILEITQTEVEIQALYTKYSQKNYPLKHILKVTQDGYFFLNGKYIPELSYEQEKVNYVEF